MTTTTISARDRAILRALAERVRAIAADPVMAERRRLWTQMNDLRAERPMVLTETNGAWSELLPPAALQCADEWARNVERDLRDKIFFYERVGDDMVIEPYLTYTACVRSSGYGVEAARRRGDDGDGHGSYTWEPPLKHLPDDLATLHFRTFEHDAAATRAQGERLAEVFDGILPVRYQGRFWWTQGLTIVAINLIGLEELMLAMYDAPEGLHALMAFLRDDHLQCLAWHEAAGLLTVNNTDDYIGSGGRGYTTHLPGPDYLPGRPARLRDLWGLSESQETVGVSPELFAEFIFPYQAPVIERFGLACYGCCEPIDTRWHLVRQLRNLRRVSVSPWSDVRAMAEHLGPHYVFSRKPNPAYVSSAWEPEVIRRELRDTLEATRANRCNVELVLKDVHTVAHEPDRLGRWTRLAREVIDEVYG